MSKYVFEEPKIYTFTHINGHSGKNFNTPSELTNQLIIECEDKLTVVQRQQESEFSYYIIEGSGYFVIDGNRETVSTRDLVVIPPMTPYTFGGKLRMLLTNTPHYDPSKEEIIGPS